MLRDRIFTALELARDESKSGHFITVQVNEYDNTIRRLLKFETGLDPEDYEDEVCDDPWHAVAIVDEDGGVHTTGGSCMICDFDVLELNVYSWN